MNLAKIRGLSGAVRDSVRLYKHLFGDQNAYAEMRDANLRRAVYKAYYETDFYRRKYDAHGVRPEEIRGVADLHKLPIVTKQELIDNFESAIPTSLERSNAYLMGTSGSTGKPIQVYKDYGFLTHFLAALFQGIRQHKLGFPKTAIIIDNLSDDNIESTIENHLKIVRSRFRMMTVEQDIRNMIHKVEVFNPDYILSYTGIVRELANLKLKGLGASIQPKKIAVTGEMLDNYTRELIEKAFGCPCYSIYASTEGSFIGWECEEQNMHVKADSVTIEVVDEKGQLLPAGQNGHILMTCHDGGNGTPIIRYSGCSDLSCIQAEPCRCGLHTPTLGPIQGRVVDSVHLPDGRIYHAFTMTIPMEKLMRRHFDGRIARYQIVQHELDEITISMVRNGEEAIDDLLALTRHEYSQMFGEQVNLEVIEVKSLPRTDNAGIPTPLVMSLVGRERSQKIATLSAS